MTRPTDMPAGHFTLGVALSSARVVVVVRGVVDWDTAPELATVLAGLAGRGHPSVVLDLAECDLIDPAGLRVIAESAQHLALWGGTLSICSPSGVVRRLLDLVGPAGVTLLEGPKTLRAAGLDLQRSVDAARVAAVTRLGPVAGRPEAPLPGSVDGDPVDGALRLVAALARALVGGAGGAGVSLRRHDRLATVARQRRHRPGHGRRPVRHRAGTVR